MLTKLTIGELTIDVLKKNIKNLHLRVCAPSGMVRVSAPHHMSFDSIRQFTLSKLTWIKKQQKKIQERAPQPLLDYLDRESLFIWGQRRLFKVIESAGPSKVQLLPGLITLTVRPGASKKEKLKRLDLWFRDQVTAALPPVLAKWEPLMGVKSAGFFVRKMKSKWGCCHYRTGLLRFNSELAKKNPVHFEYVVVHELAHLLEPSHNARFKSIMDQFIPAWRQLRKQLNAHE